jgi:hypothetical protein
MTSRIQEDGAVSSEAKWADIGRRGFSVRLSEIDLRSICPLDRLRGPIIFIVINIRPFCFAPETIEWTDGTKVNLTQPHTEPPPAPGHRETKEISAHFASELTAPSSWIREVIWIPYCCFNSSSVKCFGWAPETIEWTDGTKVNLTQPHTEPPPAPGHRETKD